MAGLGRDLAAAAATLETVAPGEDRELVAELLAGVQTKMGHLVTASTQYGKLKVASLDTSHSCGHYPCSSTRRPCPRSWTCC